MSEKKSKIFEYTEKHYQDQFLKVKIIVDQGNYDIWRSILNDSNNKKNIKSLNCKYKGTYLNEIFDTPLPEKINNLSKEKIIPLFYFILECDDISALGEYEENNDFTNPTGDAPNDIGFREITDGIKSEIEWSSEVIKYDTL